MPDLQLPFAQQLSGVGAGELRRAARTDEKVQLAGALGGQSNVDAADPGVYIGVQIEPAAVRSAFGVAAADQRDFSAVKVTVSARLEGLHGGIDANRTGSIGARVRGWSTRIAVDVRRIGFEPDGRAIRGQGGIDYYVSARLQHDPPDACLIRQDKAAAAQTGIDRNVLPCLENNVSRQGFKRFVADSEVGIGGAVGKQY